MKSEIGTKEALKFVWQTAKGFPLGITIMISVALYWALDLSIRPYILKILLDRASEKGVQDFWYLATPALWWLAMSFGLISIFRLYGYFIEIKMIPDMYPKLSSFCMERLFLQSHQFYQDNFSGSLANKVNDIANHVPKLIQIITDRFLSNFILIIASVIMLWQVNSTFGIIMLSWITVFFSVAIILLKYILACSTALSEYGSIVNGKIVDSLSNILLIRLFSRSSYERLLIDEASQKTAEAERKLYWMYFILWSFTGFSFVMSLGLDFYFLITGYIAGKITVGDFAFVITISIHIVDQLWSLSDNISQFSKSLGRITQGLKPILAVQEIIDTKNAKEIIISKGEIKFQKVKFYYKDTKTLFEDKSITIPSGQKVGLVGYSGSGKSAFVNLILRMFDISGGQILIDEQNIQNVTQNSLRAAIGMIPQDSTLFHRTLMDNIRYGRIDASDEEVIEAAKRAHAHEFITKLPLGYQSLVGERGIKLSGGQRQRIAIARAILKNAPILMLDEATSQLDSVTESDIQDSLEKLMQNKTTIVIAHRLSTLLHMDRIIVFDQGKIMEDGTHAELLAKGGLYKILWDAQVGGFLPATRGG